MLLVLPRTTILIERIFLLFHIELPPPSKKRRGLAGSIVSTAVNAALIGTAVGLTVYRLPNAMRSISSWRGRGKDPHAIETADPASPDSENGSAQQFPPPPPYQEREWTPVSYPSPPAEHVTPPSASASATTPRRKAVQRSIRRTRRPRLARPQTAPSPGRAGPSTTHVQPPEFNFGRGEEDGGDDQMDWIQDKLSQLIEEGKRALSREIVVLSDAKEDEFDDGSGVWEEEEDNRTSSSSIGRTGSLRRGTKRSRAQTHFYEASNNSSHPLLTSTPRRTHTKAFSADSVTRGIMREDENAWESPELRETMRLARERLLAGRGMP
ncbi:hypothetical protein D9756_008462 [Leucocoprinus leucothites]|uniref:Uncharacterized protein n=1 Tax=Leucocoprinus leucothites TaxID=201217 RepID=A0A8H5D311_9AGAR|nr:hypothetical protein D9756_008462 [Leucoagaricus leucothites]